MATEEIKSEHETTLNELYQSILSQISQIRIPVSVQFN